MDALDDLVGFAASKFLLDYIMKAEPLPLEQALGYAGLVFDESEDKPKDEKRSFEPNPEVSLGITTRVKEGRVYISQVRRDSNGWKAGLDFDDEILAINQRRTTAANFEKILGWSHPGDEVNLLISRSHTIKTIAVRLAPKPKKLKLKKIDSPTKLQQEIYAAVFNPLGVDEKKAADEGAKAK